MSDGNYLEMVEQLRYDRDKYIGMWRSQCNIAEEVMKERDCLTAKLEEAMEEAKVWQDRYRKRGYVMDEHAKALERAEVAEAERDRYKAALDFYAAVENYCIPFDGAGVSVVESDGGVVAHDALKEVGNE